MQQQRGTNQSGWITDSATLVGAVPPHFPNKPDTAFDAKTLHTKIFP